MLVFQGKQGTLADILHPATYSLATCGWGIFFYIAGKISQSELKSNTCFADL